jgi:hypothetical protein
MIENQILYKSLEQTTEPLLMLLIPVLTIQNVFEKGNLRYYNFLSEKISTVIDIYDFESFRNKSWPNYYNKNNPLTSKNEISPLSH